MSFANITDAIERDRADFGYDDPEAHEEAPWTDEQYARQRRVLEWCAASWKRRVR